MIPDAQNTEFGNIPQSSESLRSVPQGSEAFGNVPHPSAPFRNIPNASETFRTAKVAERKENHVLTVRETARLFEAAGVARTERSIINWCWPNKGGISRLDAYLDPNEGRYFITPQSVDAAIKEELAKAAKHAEASETHGDVPNRPERHRDGRSMDSDVEDLRFKLRESEISSRMKDQYIARVEQQNEKLINQLVDFSHTIGQLENQVRQLEPPKAQSEEAKRVHVVSEPHRPSEIE